MTYIIDLALANVCEDIYIYAKDRGQWKTKLHVFLHGHEFYTGSIWSRPLTYNLGLKSLKILYQTALCMESTCKIQNELGRWMERNYSSDKNFTQVCYDQNHNRCDKHKKKKNRNFFKEQCTLKNTVWVKYWLDWSKKRENKFKIKINQRFAMVPIEFSLLVVSILIWN